MNDSIPGMCLPIRICSLQLDHRPHHHPGQNAETWAMTIVYGIALLVLYWDDPAQKDPVHRHYKH